jgi:uncharacterized membrane protein
VPLIDQRILIDAPPQVIWDYLADPNKLPRWHAGYASVSVLTTQQTGAGTRRRCALVGGGHDVIEEITAWVDGLGYEYRLVGGGPYRSFQARIRLQAGPDGVSAQWTVSYRPKGALGAIRDRLGGRRKLVAMMAESLRRLRRQIDSLGLRMDADYRARVGIQGRLNASERAQYQRRHPVPEGVDYLTPVSANVTPVPESAIPDLAFEPDLSVPSFVADLAGGSGAPDYSHTADTQPKAPPGLREAIAAQSALAAPPDDSLAPPSIAPPVADEPPLPRLEPASPFARPTPEVGPPPPAYIAPPVIAPERAQPSPEAPQPPPVSDFEQPTPPRGIPAVRPASAAPPAERAPERIGESPSPTPGQRPPAPPQTPAHDTGEISIWDVFGVRRPSEQDTETLEDLFQSVQARRTAEMQLRERRAMRPARARAVRAAPGLRLSLARRTAHARTIRAQTRDRDV